MNVEKIKEIVNMEISENNKESLILKEISKDEKVIPYLLNILEMERKLNKRILDETNTELSRALVVLDKSAFKNQKRWAIEQIKQHYLKWKDFIRCNFSVDGLP